LQAADFTFGGRDEVEDPLHEELQAVGLGEVTGGGSGLGIANIDVEVTNLVQGLAAVRRVLQRLGVAPSSRINQYEPSRVVHLVYPERA